MRLSVASDPAEINSPLPRVKFEAPDAAPIDARVQLLPCMSQSVTSLGFSAGPFLHVSRELEPAGAAPNPGAGKISPEGEPSSSRPLRCKFSRLPGPPRCFGRSRKGSR